MLETNKPTNDRQNLSSITNIILCSSGTPPDTSSYKNYSELQKTKIILLEHFHIMACFIHKSRCTLRFHLFYRWIWSSALLWSERKTFELFFENLLTDSLGQHLIRSHFTTTAAQNLYWVFLYCFTHKKWYLSPFSQKDQSLQHLNTSFQVFP